MQISTEQIQAVLRSKITSDEVRTSLNDPSILGMGIRTLDEAQFDDLHDAALYALTNEASVVQEFNAEQDLGEYAVIIAGVPGAYYVHAAERDREGVFSSIEEARAHAKLYYGEFFK